VPKYKAREFANARKNYWITAKRIKAIDKRHYPVKCHFDVG
jgi:hypothetical protein